MNLDDQMSSLAEVVLKRPMTEEEKNEIYRISDALGMNSVQSFLHLLFVFKLHEDVMKKRFDEMAELEKRLNDTLGSSVEQILGEGASTIGADMGDRIAFQAQNILSSVKEHYEIRGHIVSLALLCIMATLAYWLGRYNILAAAPSGSAFETLLLLPGGWSLFLCGSAYLFFWASDYWEMIRKTKLYKAFLGLQVFLLGWLLVFLL
ncbi:hypothetical protein FACS1894167_05950 [Synergistales bacterium]|nr:hypothetical protein FACS1894167_05950 [Synergistales bacterium]